MSRENGCILFVMWMQHGRTVVRDFPTKMDDDTNLKYIAATLICYEIQMDTLVLHRFRIPTADLVPGERRKMVGHTRVNNKIHRSWCGLCVRSDCLLSQIKLQQRARSNVSSLVDVIITYLFIRTSKKKMIEINVSTQQPKCICDPSTVCEWLKR